MKSAREIFEGMVRQGPRTKVQKLHPDARIPFLAHPGEDAGWDICALEGTTLKARAVTLVRTGLAIEPPMGAWYQIETRGSFAKKNLFVVGGIIDWGYRGEILVPLANLNPYPDTIAAGTVVAQLIERCMPTIGFLEVKELTSSKRAEKGFGSTDEKFDHSIDRTGAWSGPEDSL